MSKGLGKIERAVIEFLEGESRGGSTGWIAYAIFFPKYYEEDKPGPDPTPAQYKSLLRALNSLERKGFLTSEKEPTRFEAPISWRKVYTLTPRTDFRAIST
jgi:hypothetical protein